MSYFLFLDDQRKPSAVKFEDHYEFLEKVHVKNYIEFCNVLETRGLPKALSLDFDLHPNHYKAGSRSSFTSISNYKYVLEKHGGNCVEYLTSFCQKKNLQLPKWFIHSQNPAGATYMRNLLKTFENSQNKEKNGTKS